MPHKHKRRKLNSDNDVDRPPTSLAKPLAVEKARKHSSRRNDKQNAYKTNDTPKAFARLMTFKKTGRGTNGLDNGTLPGKSRKANTPTAQKREQSVAPAPTILPGESISAFSARVDRALPVSGLAKRGKKVEGVRDHRVTKHERRLKRLQENWRREDERLKAKAEEEREIAEEAGEEMWRGRERRKGRKRGAGKEDEDPWAVLERDKPRGLMDVVTAPPVFKSVPKEKFKVRGGARVEVADVPSKAGSLRRREELGETRRSVIERYREMMSVKRVNG